jgi:hypothetical protein
MAPRVNSSSVTVYICVYARHPLGLARSVLRSAPIQNVSIIAIEKDEML